MITVLLEKDRDRLERLYFESGEDFTGNSEAVVAKDGEDRLGFCLFTLDEEKIAIGKLEPTDDLSLADGVLRSALHVAVTNGILSARYTDSAPVEVLRHLDFIENDENKGVRIDKLFSTCQNCGDEK